MPMDISLIISLLGSALGITANTDALSELFKKLFKEKINQTSNIVKTDSFERIVEVTIEKESEIVTETALEVLDVTYKSSLALRDERMRQARLAFNAAISLMIIGVLIIFIGVALLWIKPEIAKGAVTIAVGAITEVISMLVFSFNKDTNNRLEEVRKELSSIETARVGLSIARQISNIEKRDEAIAELTRRINNNG